MSQHSTGIGWFFFLNDRINQVLSLFGIFTRFCDQNRQFAGILSAKRAIYFIVSGRPLSALRIMPQREHHAYVENILAKPCPVLRSPGCSDLAICEALVLFISIIA